MVQWSSADTRVAWAYVDPDVKQDQVHLPIPMIRVDFGRRWGCWYNNNQYNSKGFSCCCLCCFQSDSGLCSFKFMSFTVTGFLGVTIGNQLQMKSATGVPMLSKHWAVNVESPAFCSCICPIYIPQGRDFLLGQKRSFTRIFFRSCFDYCIDILKGVQ